MLLENQKNVMVKRKDNKLESIRYLSEKLWKKLLNIFDICILHREDDNTFQPYRVV